jgi:hypothetical protein
MHLQLLHLLPDVLARIVYWNHLVHLPLVVMGRLGINMAASRNADVTKKFKNRVSLSFSFPLFPLRCVEGINLSFWTAGGRPKT